MDVAEQARPVKGFRFAGISAGLKAVFGKPDLGLIVAERPAAAAGVFTTNQVKAAAVILAQNRLRAGRLQAVVANSGCANCFTGKPGMKLALDSCAVVAKEISCPLELVAPCSTGVIGHLYDLEKFRTGVRAAAASLSHDGLDSFARAIMTTDTVPKVASTTIRFGGVDVTIAGAAKGAGMIAPRMATLLSFIVTDADLPSPVVRRALIRALPESFNAITIDGDMSTNDSLIMLASGAAGNRRASARDLAGFEKAVGATAASLARQLIYDGEGATRLVTIEVRGARTKADATKIARQIANSPLVKTAFFGCDPNVGRIVAAAGAVGVALEPNRVALTIGGVKVSDRGMILTRELPAAAAAMGQREFTVRLDLRLGNAGADVLTCDLSLDYVRINAEYTT
ncbi:MAG TPA: bifunctional glutamate N-acetyltransferase/amino-acid acetyltransferase ArgJ [Candidatus Binataceae bacterium]|nr:bifunctional glutamate N-acetyltransferase/amino-acid acetyltransferase ArgJ [Candidatus Binataceae bacterium]